MVSKTPLEDLFDEFMKAGLNSRFEKGTIEHMMFRTMFFMAITAPGLAIRKGVASGATEEEITQLMKNEMELFHKITMERLASRFN